MRFQIREVFRSGSEPFVETVGVVWDRDEIFVHACFLGGGGGRELKLKFGGGFATAADGGDGGDGLSAEDEVVVARGWAGMTEQQEGH